MKIKLKNTPDQDALIRAMGSKDTDVSRKAMKIFANLVGPIAKKVIDETNIVDSLYDTLSVGEYEPRTIPLDDYFDVSQEDYVRVAMSSKPGDLSYSQVVGADDIPFTTFFVSSALAMTKKYLRAGRVNHAENAIRKMINEVVAKLKVQGIQPILDQVGNSTTNDLNHVIRSQTADQLVLEDFNKLQTRMARILTSQFGNTAPGGTSGTRSIDKMFMSPEMVEEIRGMAYNPQKVGTNTDFAAPESVREETYRSAGISSIYGTEIVQLNEMGVGADFSVYFNALSDVAYEGHGGSGTAQFNVATEELILAVSNAETNGLLKVEIKDGETGSTFETQPDDQFVAREGKTGFYGQAEVGYIATNAKNLAAIIV